MRAIVGALLVVALSGAACEEAPGVALKSATASNIAGFETTNDATEYAKIDLDVRDIETELKKATAAGYAEALRIFKVGKNSKKSDTEMRTLEGMRLNDGDMRRHGTPLGKLYADYNAAAPYTPHDSVVAALNGTDGTYGKYETGSISSKNEFRSQVVKKTIKVSLTPTWTAFMDSLCFSYSCCPGPLSLPFLCRFNNVFFLSFKLCSYMRFTSSSRRMASTKQALLLMRQWPLMNGGPTMLEA